jgi:hypothetical protein
VDLCDCDVLLPAPYEVVPDMDPANWPVEESFMSLGAHLKLCILVGRVLKTIYSPTGLKHATDEQLETLLADFDAWLRDLPEQLRYKGPGSSHNAGKSLSKHHSSELSLSLVPLRRSIERSISKKLIPRPPAFGPLRPSILILASVHAYNPHPPTAPHCPIKDRTMVKTGSMVQRINRLVIS